MDRMETNRLILRSFTKEDWADLYDYLSKEEVVRYEPYGTYNEKQSKEEAIIRSNNPAFIAVCLKDTGKLIGNLYFNEEAPSEFGTWELGYVFNNNYQGKGYATEACKQILKYGFEHMNIRRIIAMCNPLNTSSWRLLDRLKMRREGHFIQNVSFKQDESGKPIWTDTYSYAMLKTEWDSMNQ